MKHNFSFTWLALIAGCVCCYGCGSPDADTDISATAVDELTADEAESVVIDPATYEQQMGGESETRNEIFIESHSGLKPVDFYGDLIVLSGDNTSVGFMGTKPNGEKHAGGFGFVEGKFAFSTKNELKGLNIRIVAKSLWSDNPTLTNHLKSPDFFNVNEHADITFKSTSITDEGDGKFAIKGDLTMLGVTKEISIPAQLGVTSQGATLTSEFNIDRTEFGMNFQVGKIDAVVGMTVVVGKEGGPPTADAPANTPE